MSNDLGALTDSELAKNRILRTTNDIKLYVDGITYEFPRKYDLFMPKKDLIAYLQKHDEARHAILTDGHNPVQLSVLEENRKMLEQAIQEKKAEHECYQERAKWCWWITPET
ncbi:MAG: hypothetical protein QXR48_04235 [Candidatus Woesearchaeota archaeon]